MCLAALLAGLFRVDRLIQFVEASGNGRGVAPQSAVLFGPLIRIRLFLHEQVASLKRFGALVPKLYGFRRHSTVADNHS